MVWLRIGSQLGGMLREPVGRVMAHHYLRQQGDYIIGTAESHMAVHDLLYRVFKTI